jgi:hypothetical protein
MNGFFTNFILMNTKHIIFSIGIACILTSCTTNSGPDVCDCAQNALKIITPTEFDAKLHKECEDYSKSLTPEQKDLRALEALKCI